MLRSLGIGVRVTWANLTGKPAVFAPAPHTHAYADLTGVPTSFAPSAHTHAWSDIAGKPNLFPPSAHTHLWADITDKPVTFPPSAHSHAWGEITGKPATFAPSAHTHLWADITDRPTIPAATPLGIATPKALGTAAPGTSANAAHEDHVHPLPPGLLQLVGSVVVTETTLLALGLGMKRMTLTLAGITSADMGKLIVVPNGAATTGCEVQNAYPTATAGQVSIGYFTPALGLAATYSIPVSVYRITQ